MAIYQLNGESIDAMSPTTFAKLGITERGDLQRLLRDQVDIISPDTLVISEEFGDWDESRRRIDLLGVDKDANLVVIELKRVEDGGHMELQALRYAAMVSTMTFDRAVDIFDRYNEFRKLEVDARQCLLDHLEWEEPNDDEFANDVRIVLASAEFSKELTTAVLWLSERQIDIRCVRIKPYGEVGRVLIDVQQVIPLPEAEDYQIRVREKRQADRVARRSSSDFTRYTVTDGDQVLESLPKRRALHAVIQGLCARGVSPERISESIDWRRGIFFVLDGNVNSEEFVAEILKRSSRNTPKNWFCDDAELIRFNGSTYALRKGWGNRVVEAMQKLIENFEPEGLSFERAE